MSFVRHCLQHLSRQFSGTIPRKVRFVNSDIVDKYQRIQDATSDTFLHRRYNSSTDCDNATKRYHKFEKFPYLGKLMRLLALSVCVGGASRKKIGEAQKLVMPAVSAAFSAKVARAPSHKKKKKETSLPQIEAECKRSEHTISSECPVAEYAQQLKHYSSPEKVFRYFASVCLVSDKDTEIVMTPADFLHSICPSRKQPKNLGLDRCIRIDRDDVHKLEFTLVPKSVFFLLGSNGFITYPDYQFLMTVLTTPAQHFKIAFQMFDSNHDGVLDADEFQHVASLARHTASFVAVGQNLRNNSIPKPLLMHFFGRDLKGSLSIDEFLKFQTNFKQELLTLEFYTKPNISGYISETDFAELLIAYTGYTKKERQEKIHRVRQQFRKNPKGVSKNDYLDFWNLINNLNDVEMAMSFYSLTGSPIDKQTLHYIVKTIAKVQLSDQCIDVAYTIFDDKDDDKVCKRQFVDAMKKQLYRGMGPKTDSNFNELLLALKKCATERRTYDF